MLLALTGAPQVMACTACYGKSDSAMAQGMNWGIYTLLIIIGLVLMGVASFFIFIIRRGMTMPVEPNSTPASAKV